MRSVVCFSFLFLSLSLSAQQKNALSSNGFKIPGNLKETLSLLDDIFQKKAKQKLTQLSDAELRKLTGIHILTEWAENDSTPFVKYFNQYRISNKNSNDRDFIVLLAYRSMLNGKVFEMEKEVRKINHRNDSIENLRRLEYEKLISKETINGFYIPTDLADCVRILDNELPDSTKKEIKSCLSGDVVATYHMTTGLWMRNSWGLWKGSRLQKYMIDNGFDHPDGMSGVILKAYYHYLHDNTPDYGKVMEEYKLEFKKLMELISANERQMNGPVSYSDSYREFIKTKKIVDFSVPKY